MLMYVYTTFCLSIHLPMGIWVFSTFWLFVNNVAMNISVQISSSLSILLGLDQEVELLDYMCVRKKKQSFFLCFSFILTPSPHSQYFWSLNSGFFSPTPSNSL